VGFPIEIFLAFLLAVIIIVLFMTLVTRYRRCPSNKVLVIFGKTGRGAARTIHGGAAFVWPVVQDYAYLDLEPFVVPIELTNALSRENIRVTVPTTVTAAISTEEGLMQNAAVRLLGLSQQEIKEQAQDIILGQMRAVIATMAIEEINRDRQAFMAKVNDAVSTELEKIGLTAITSTSAISRTSPATTWPSAKKPRRRRSTRRWWTWPSRSGWARRAWPSGIATAVVPWLPQTRRR